MRQNLIKSLVPRLPLKVESIEFADPVITLIGREWSLGLACPWRLLEGEDERTAWDLSDVEDAAWDLIGCDIVAVRWARNAVDPIFDMTGEMSLVVEADTDLDPWVLRLSGQTFVGSMA